MAGPYFVDGAVGDDGNAGTSEGAGNAWATIDKAMNTVIAGDKVWVKASADYIETATLDTVGTSAAPIVFEGYTSSTGDEGQATIKNSTDGFVAATGAWYYTFKNFIITGHSNRGFDGTTAADSIRLENCNIHNNSGIGVFFDNNCVLIRCKIHDNGLTGALTDNNSTVIACVFYNNSGGAIDLQGSAVFIGNLLYDNTNAASDVDVVVLATFTASSNVFVNNTFDGDASSVAGAIGLLNCTDSFTAVVVFNNIFFDGDTGFEVNTAHHGVFGDYNVFKDVTTKRTNIDAGEHDIDDPTTLGLNANYTLAANSEAKAAGVDAGLLAAGAASFIDIGGLQREEAGGGGGGVIRRIPKVLGGS